jgi:flagellar biogenesis protein FliO
MMEGLFLSTIRVFLILAGIVAGLLVLRRYIGQGKFGLKPRDSGYGLKKADTLHLGYKKFVSVVEVKDYVLVLGVGEKEMVLLSQWKKEGTPS